MWPSATVSKSGFKTKNMTGKRHLHMPIFSNDSTLKNRLLNWNVYFLAIKHGCNKLMTGRLLLILQFLITEIAE